MHSTYQARHMKTVVIRGNVKCLNEINVFKVNCIMPTTYTLLRACSLDTVYRLACKHPAPPPPSTSAFLQYLGKNMGFALQVRTQHGTVTFQQHGTRKHVLG
jgi:hypothetical protein